MKRKLKRKPVRPTVALTIPTTEPLTLPQPKHEENLQVVSTEESLLTMAVKNGANIDTIERLAKLFEEHRAKKAFRAYHDAMTQLQKTLIVIPHNRSGDANKYTYADIGQIVKTAGPKIADAGFSYRFEFKDVTNTKIQERKQLIEDIVEAVKKFDFEKDKLWKLEKLLIDILLTKEIEVTCVVTHREGHSERTTMTGPEDHSGSKNAIQSRGSSTSYLERYTLIGAFGLVTADSDPDGRKRLPGKPEDKKKVEQAEQQTPTPQRPAMPEDRYKKAFKMITDGEDYLQTCKDRFTLTEAQQKGLEAADEIRKLALVKKAAEKV